MGLFSSKATCALCGKDVGLSRHRLADKELICPDCYKKSQYMADAVIKTISAEEAKKAIAFAEEQKSKAAAFSPTKKIGKLLELNENEKQWLLHTGVYSGHGNDVVFEYKDIIDFELLEDKATIVRRGPGRTVELVENNAESSKQMGMCASIKINIKVNNINNPIISASLLYAPTVKNNRYCKKLISEAMECLSALQLICDSLEVERGGFVEPQEGPISAADEIWKFKGLLDSGVITQEEFEAKKKQLLDL